MNTSLYREYRRSLESGNRKEAAERVRAFIDSCDGSSDRAAWVHDFLEDGDYGHKIRHEIYRDLIFPELHRGYGSRDPWSLYFLACTIQNCYDAQDLHEAIDLNTDLSLLRTCFKIDSDFRDVREQLMERIIRWLEYCIHEWPAGILYGPDAATDQELNEIESEIDFTRALDESGQYRDFLDDVAAKVSTTKQRANKAREGKRRGGWS